jgi:hypothetical protein
MNRWRCRALAAAFALAGGVAVAQVAPVAPPATDAEDSVATVRNDYYALMRANSKKQEKAKLPDGVFLPLVTEADLLGFVDRCWKIYDRNEGEPEIEFAVLQQVMTFATEVDSDQLADHWRDAADKLFRAYLDDDRMVEFAMRMPTTKKHRKLAEQYTNDLKTKSKSVAVKAAFDFAALQGDLDRSAQGALNEAQEKELVAKLEKLAADFGAQPVPYRKTTYSDFVKQQLYMMEHLKVGAIAPDIEGKDLDGVAFKLSDYRGKAVMLDFWGYW